MDMIQLNCVGDICPVPVIKVKKALAEHTALAVTVDNDIAVENISKYLKAMDATFTTQADGAHFVITINREGTTIPAPTQGVSGTAVVISSQYMGRGTDALGAILIKGFIFAQTQLETLPGTIIFYNGGVQHTLENAPSIADLQYLQDNGVKILVCGTCLNYHGVKNAVGEVTDMYNIATILQNATHIIKP